MAEHNVDFQGTLELGASQPTAAVEVAAHRPDVEDGVCVALW